MSKKIGLFLISFIVLFTFTSNYAKSVKRVGNLTLNKKLYHSIILNMPASFRVFVKNRNDVYVACSKTFAASLDKTPAEIVGKTDYQITNKVDAAKYRADDRKVMDSNKAKLNYMECALNKQGKQTTVITSKVPLHNKKGKVIGIIGISYLTSNQPCPDLKTKK